MKKASINDKYALRSEGIEKLTLSQFATSYSKCANRPKKVIFNNDGGSDEKGDIIDHSTEDLLPKHIKLTTNEVYYLRKFSTVLRIHNSSKKSGEEELFA